MRNKHGTIPTEHDEQVTFFHWLHVCHREVYEHTYSVPNGIRCSYSQARKHRSEGLKSGVPDIIIDFPIGKYHGARIELKRSKGGKLSSEQIEWLTRLEKKGYAVRVCNGFEEAKKFTESYLKGRL